MSVHTLLNSWDVYALSAAACADPAEAERFATVLAKQTALDEMFATAEAALSGEHQAIAENNAAVMMDLARLAVSGACEPHLGAYDYETHMVSDWRLDADMATASQVRVGLRKLDRQKRHWPAAVLQPERRWSATLRNAGKHFEVRRVTVETFPLAVQPDTTAARAARPSFVPRPESGVLYQIAAEPSERHVAEPRGVADGWTSMHRVASLTSMEMSLNEAINRPPFAETYRVAAEADGAASDASALGEAQRSDLQRQERSAQTLRTQHLDWERLGSHIANVHYAAHTTLGEVGGRLKYTGRFDYSLALALANPALQTLVRFATNMDMAVLPGVASESQNRLAWLRAYGPALQDAVHEHMADNPNLHTEAHRAQLDVAEKEMLTLRSLVDRLRDRTVTVDPKEWTIRPA